MKHVFGMVLVFAAGGLAQVQADVVRVPHPGRVVAADGAPVPGAEVTLVSIERDLVAGAPDVVHATADDKGRFRAQVLPTCGYHMWAARSLAAGVEVSDVVLMAMPTTEVRFGKDGRAAGDRLRIAGVDAWKDKGQLRVRITVGGSAAIVPERDLAADGTCPLPPYGACEVEAFVFCNGSLVHHEPLGGSRAFELPAPHRIRALVVDGDGKPVGGAQIERIVAAWPQGDLPFPMGMQSVTVAVATTAADGTAEFWLAHASDPFQGAGYPPMVFLATAEGHCRGTAGFTRSVFCNRGIVTPDAANPVLRFELTKAVEVPWTVKNAAATTVVELVGNHSVPVEENGTTTLPAWLNVGPADARGLPATFQALFARVRGRMPALAADDPYRRAVAPRPVLAAAQTNGAFACDQAAVQPLRMQWIDGTGGPAMGAAVVCMPLDGGTAAGGLVPAIADSAGRLVLPVLPGRHYVCAVRGDEWLGQEVDIAAGQGPITLRLQKLDRMQVRIVDGDGRPIVGAKFRNTGASWSNGPGIVEDFLCDLGNHLAAWQLGRAISDADGRATIPFLALRQQHVDFEVQVENRSSGELRLRATDGETIDVVVK